MRKLLLAAAAALALCGSAGAQALGVSGWPNTTNVLNISSATTTKVIAENSARTVDVTEIMFTSAGAGTVELEYGTTVTNPCDTGTVALTGAFVVAAAPYQWGDGLGSLFQVPAGDDVCIVTTSSATVVGWIGYNYQTGF